MKSDKEKLNLIRKFMNVSMQSPKKRPRMYGSVLEIESGWRILDELYFVLEGIPEEFNYFRWRDFLHEKGFGPKRPNYEELNPEDPYVALIKMRNEYEGWGKRRRGLKKFKKPIKFIYPKNYKGFWFEKHNR